MFYINYISVLWWSFIGDNADITTAQITITKQGIHRHQTPPPQSQRRQRRTQPRPQGICTKISWRSAQPLQRYARGQTDTRTNRQTNWSQYSDPLPGRSNNSKQMIENATCFKSHSKLIQSFKLVDVRHNSCQYHALNRPGSAARAQTDPNMISVTTVNTKGINGWGEDATVMSDAPYSHVL